MFLATYNWLFLLIAVISISIGFFVFFNNSGRCGE
jgi:hypothetical protein